jgi:hypothetical protein
MKSTKLKTATAIAGGALTMLAVPAGTAHAGTPPQPGSLTPRAGSAAGPKAAVPDANCGGNAVTWQDRHDNRYLEIYHSGTGNGNWADAYPGNGTCTQHWFAVASGTGSNGYGYTWDRYGMVNTNSDKCLAAPTTSVGNTHVKQESCGAAHYTYRWYEISDSSGWLLVEGNAPSYNHNANISHSAIIACEDESNHYIYTSWAYVNGGVDNLGAKNCIWH